MAEKPDNASTEGATGVATEETPRATPRVFAEEPIEQPDGSYITRSELEAAEAKAGKGGRATNDKDKPESGEAKDDAPTKGEESGDDGDEAKDVGEDDDVVTLPRSKLQALADRRIGKATRKQRAAERRAEEAERRAAELEAKLAQQQTRSPATAPKDKPRDEAQGPPSLEDFDYDVEAYQEATRTYYANGATKPAPTTRAPANGGDQDAAPATTPPSQPPPATMPPEKAAAVREMFSYGKEEFPDFQAVMLADDNRIDAALFDALLDSDYGAPLAYQLAKDQKTTDHLNSLGDDPAALAREIGRLEARYEASLNKDTPSPGEPSEPTNGTREEAPPPQRQQAPRPRRSNAPDPIQPIVTGNGRANMHADPSKMSPAEYRKWRAAGGGSG